MNANGREYQRDVLTLATLKVAKFAKEEDLLAAKERRKRKKEEAGRLAAVPLTRNLTRQCPAEHKRVCVCSDVPGYPVSSITFILAAFVTFCLSPFLVVCCVSRGQQLLLLVDAAEGFLVFLKRTRCTLKVAARRFCRSGIDGLP